jgi:hypothetical protein
MILKGKGEVTPQACVLQQCCQDHGTVVDIALDHATLTSTSDLDLLAGVNLLTLQGPMGWELLQGRKATLLGPGQYRLPNPLRSRRES